MGFGQLQPHWYGIVESAADVHVELDTGLLPHQVAREVLRVEAGVPRFGQDMTEVTIPLEANLERALHYKKGCYIGQEVIARLHAFAQVAKSLRVLRFPGAGRLPAHGEKLFIDGREVGYVTGCVIPDGETTGLAMGYVRKEHQQPGTEIEARSAAGEAVVLRLAGSPGAVVS